MEGSAFLEELKNLISQENLIAVGREVNELSAKFEDYVYEEERKLQVAQMDAEEQGLEIPENPQLIQLKESFKTILFDYRTKKKALIETKNAEESRNLSKKNALINQLRDTIQHEENIGAAFGKLKEIQDAWKEISDIPRDKRHDVQSEYSKLIEEFFYNINIYKELKENDLKRNVQLKQEIVDKLVALEQESSIKVVEHELKLLQNEWEEIGPVHNDEWEVLKDNYWKAVHNCYSKINVHYEKLRETLLQNLEVKQEILSKITNHIDALPEEQSVKQWEQSTKSILQFQDDWKQAGFGPRKQNEEIWKQFRIQCDRFFDLKKDFFAKIQTEFDVIAEKKKELIVKAQALQASTDWKNTASQLKNLQANWRKLGNAGKKHEQRLWKQFRAACDVFFNNRQQHFDIIDAEAEQNLKAKNDIIEQIKAYQVGEDKKRALADLKQFAQSFAALGKVPFKQKEPIYKAFKDALDQHYKSLDLQGEEKENILFQAKLDTLKGNPNASKLFAKEKAEIRKKIDTIMHDMLQLENNLGFFANSKGADSLKKDVERKIELANQEIETLRKKIKLIPNE